MPSLVALFTLVLLQNFSTSLYIVQTDEDVRGFQSGGYTYVNQTYEK